MSSTQSLSIIPGNLWPAIERQTAHALSCGALRPIDTQAEILEDRGVRFLIRVASNLARKEEQNKQDERQPTAVRRNPFLPYEPDLFVSDLSDTHLCLLNKFNVLEHHLLIVTRQFEHQDTLLTLADFQALCACLAQVDGLGFYNGGETAGASQLHKHLQLVPYHDTDEEARVPVAVLFPVLSKRLQAGTSAHLPFRHGICRLDLVSSGDITARAMQCLEAYQSLLEMTGISAVELAGERRHDIPYNLLVTRTWMMLVPRTRASFDGISINSLGYAGSLFVKNRQQLTTVQLHGPVAILKAVAMTNGNNGFPGGG